MKFPRKLTIILILTCLIVLTGCGANDGDSNTQPTDAPVDEAPVTEAPADEPPPTEAPAPTDAPAPTEEPPPPTEEPAEATVTFTLVTELQTSEFIEPMIDDLEDVEVEGILGASGSEFTITITYDPDKITEAELRQIMADIGKPVKD